MDTERSGEVLDASESPQPEEAVMEKEVVSQMETPKESTEPENPAAADEGMVVNGHETQDINVKETEEVIVTEVAEMKLEDSLPTEKSEMESVPDVVVPPPQQDESSEKVSDLVTDAEPEKIHSDQQPVHENVPELLPVQTPLAESAAEPEPEKSVESAPESERPASQEEKMSEPVTEAELQPTPMDTVAHDTAADPAKGGEKEEAPNDVKSGGDEKETEPENQESDTAKGAEAGPAGDGDKSEKTGDELQKEEETIPASGSLAFAFLEQEKTKEALLTSRTVIIIRGLPGSGKSFLSHAIADTYKDHCSVICADDHGVKPESPESSVDAYNALDQAMIACCSAATASPLLIVVDDTNHTQDRLAHLGEIAEQHHLIAIFVEPLTEWSRDVAQLSKKSKRGLAETQLEVIRGHLEEVSLPLFFGWFLLSPAQAKVRCTSIDFLKTLDTLEAFKKYSIDFTGTAEVEVDLEQYFKLKGPLHCTTKFCNYGKADGAKEYAQNPAVKESYGSVFELSLTALFVTPRTVGARVSLTDEQLLLWPADAEKEAGAPASLPQGSRAHVTLGCAEGVEPVQTGLDLLEILAMQLGGQKGELVEEMELGTLTYYGEGRWLLSLREPIRTPACFSSFYGHKEVEPIKKEPEKKKKLKCTIL